MLFNVYQTKTQYFSLLNNILKMGFELLVRDGVMVICYFSSFLSHFFESTDLLL